MTDREELHSCIYRALHMRWQEPGSKASTVTSYMDANKC